MTINTVVMTTDSYTTRWDSLSLLRIGAVARCAVVDYFQTPTHCIEIPLR